MADGGRGVDELAAQPLQGPPANYDLQPSELHHSYTQKGKQWAFRSIAGMSIGSWCCLIFCGRVHT